MNKFLTSRGRNGFTLIELLVVIGILGLLMGIGIGAFGGASDSAKAAKCMSNMRALAVAAHSYAMAGKEGAFPAAGSYEYRNKKGITAHWGWISWACDRDTRNKLNKGGNKNHMASPSWTVHATYSSGSKSDRERSLFALTNGVLWEYAGRSAACYTCPKHLEVCKKKNLTVNWSYVMNGFFGYDRTQGSGVAEWDRIYETGVSSKGGGKVVLGADKVLMFAELPFATVERRFADVQNSVELEGQTAAFDCVLQYQERTSSGKKVWTGTPELIGFNHKASKSYMGHVAFADGHVAKLMLPKGASEADVKNLTTWLCQGDEVALIGNKYERVNQADKNTY